MVNKGEVRWEKLCEFVVAQLEMLSETLQRFLIGVLFAVAQVLEQRKHRSLEVRDRHEFLRTTDVNYQLAGRLFYSSLENSTNTHSLRYLFLISSSRISEKFRLLYDDLTRPATH